MGEDRDRVRSVCAGRDRVRGEVNMNQGAEREAVGLSPEQVRELNRPKPVQGVALNNPLNSPEERMTRTHLVKKAANVLAASLTAAAGVGLAGVVEEALRNTPPPIAQTAPEQDPLNRKPPEGVVFPQDIRADAPVNPVLNKRVFIPRVLNTITQAELDAAEKPRWPERFGEFAPYNFEIVNRGTKAGIIIGKQELFDNLLARLREWGNAPEVPRKIVVYEDIAQLNRESQLPYNQLFFASGDDDLYGSMAWREGKLPDGSLRLDVSIPTMKDPSRIEAWSQSAGVSVTFRVLEFIVTTDSGGSYREQRDRWGHFFNYKIYSNSYEPIFPIYEKGENNRTVAWPFLARYKNP